MYTLDLPSPFSLQDKRESINRSCSFDERRQDAEKSANAFLRQDERSLPRRHSRLICYFPANDTSFCIEINGYRARITLKKRFESRVVGPSERDFHIYFVVVEGFPFSRYLMKLWSLVGNVQRVGRELL